LVKRQLRTLQPHRLIKSEENLMAVLLYIGSHLRVSMNTGK
jgi:hypothetical protein